MLKCWIISHLNNKNKILVLFMHELLQQTHKKRPYQYDKMFEINFEFYLIELNIDQPEMKYKINI